MKESNDALYLQHIRDAIAQTEDYLVDVDEPTFLESKLLQDGFIRQLQIIGEAARRLSQSCVRSTRRLLGRTSSACVTSSSTTTLASTLRRFGQLSLTTFPTSNRRSSESWMS